MTALSLIFSLAFQQGPPQAVSVDPKTEHRAIAFLNGLLGKLGQGKWQPKSSHLMPGGGGAASSLTLVDIRGMSALYDADLQVLRAIHWPKRAPSDKIPLKSDSECRRLISAIKDKLEPARFNHIRKESFMKDQPRASIMFEDRPNGYRMFDHSNGIGIAIDRRTGGLLWIGMNTTTKVDGTTVRIKQGDVLAICRPLVAAEYRDLEREMDVSKLVIHRYQIGYAAPRLGFGSGKRPLQKPPYRLKLCAVVDLVLHGKTKGPFIRILLDAATKRSLGGEIRYADPEG